MAESGGPARSPDAPDLTEAHARPRELLLRPVNQPLVQKHDCTPGVNEIGPVERRKWQK